VDVPPAAAPGRRRLLTGLAGSLALLGSGCAIPVGGATASAGGASASAIVPTTPPAPTRTTPTPTAPTTTRASSAGTLALLPDARTGSGLDAPLIVNGLPLINRNHPVSKAFAPKVFGDYQLIPEAGKAFGVMVAAAKKAGLTIVWRVGYRGYATQTELSTNPPTPYGDDADSYVAKPGQSEHQAGLAVDVASKSGTGTRFPTTKEFTWLRSNAHLYGFVLRYPDGKTDVTGYHYEPWHYRFVGTDAAAAFGPNSTLTLEEYLGGR
jgi:zinc D-Ala-D-Ala carboxypeptidase